MTDTERTTITLSNYHMNIIKSLIGIKGNTAASVIAGVIASWIDQNLQEIKEHLQMKKLMLPPSEEEINKKLKLIMENFEKLKIDDLAKLCKIDRQLIIENIAYWSKKYNIIISGDFVIKKK